MTKIIELQDIGKKYFNGANDIPVLHKINLSIHAGEMIAIVGMSGSGKSTLLNIIGCLDNPTSGDYLIHGRHARHMTPDELAAVRRQHFGFIFQRYHLIQELTVLENIEIPAIYAMRQRDERRNDARKLLSRLGMNGRENDKPARLSGGQQQRVSIARALINGGEVILADEPSGALDSQTGQEVLQLLTELNHRGHTVIMVTHDINIAQHAQRVIELRDGMIASDNVHMASKKKSSTTLISPVITPDNPWKVFYESMTASCHMALMAMNARRLRTLLTVMGIVFGIAAVVTMTALGRGARQQTLKEISILGTDLIDIYPGKDFYDQTAGSIKTLVISDVHALAQQHYIDNVTPQLSSSSFLRYRNKSFRVNVVGVGENYFHVQGIPLAHGILFRNEERQVTGAQDAIIDDNINQMLFEPLHISPLGQVIFIDNVPVQVIGVAEKNNRFAPNTVNVWLPYNTVMSRLIGQQHLDNITVRLKKGISSYTAENAIEKLMQGRHGIKDFMLFNQDKFRKSLERTSMTFTLLITMVALISLIVGSIGVMNMMLVSVTERAHEIGIRMATGARHYDIMQQFIIESVLICLAGGVMGILLSFLAGPVLINLTGNLFPVIYSWPSMLMACLTSMLAGIIFGYLPARHAAKMNPACVLASE